MKTPIQRIIEEFESLKEKATSLKDKLYLDGVLAVIEEYKEQEKDFLSKCYEAGINRGVDVAMSIEWCEDPTKPTFDEWYESLNK